MNNFMVLATILGSYVVNSCCKHHNLFYGGSLVCGASYVKGIET